MITHREEERLPASLGAVHGHVERMVVVDAESDDRTREVAAELGAEVFVRPWSGFVDARRHALSLAATDWVLMIDADEELSASLWDELRVMGFPEVEADGFQVRRRTVFLGRRMRRAWQPDWKTVLFRHSRARIADRLVHESVLVDGTVERLRSELLHHSFESLQDHRQRIRRYAELGARELHRRGRRASWADLWLRPVWRFFSEFVLRGGFVDGTRGWIAARGSARSLYLRYRLLRDLRRQEGPGGPT